MSAGVATGGCELPEKPSLRDLDGRDVKALTGAMTVCDGIGWARGAPDCYLVVTPTGTYRVDGRDGTCDCDDQFYRQPDGGCKHVRRVRFATGERVVPADADRDALDEHLRRRLAAHD